MSLHIVLHREIPEDPKLWHRWNQLALQMEKPEVFYTSEWALAVQSAYHTSLKPLLYLGYDGDELVGIASLASDAPGEKITFLAGTTADYCDFLTPPPRRTEFVEAVLAELGKGTARSVTLPNLPANSATVAALRMAASKKRLHAHIRPAYLCSQVELGWGEQRRQLKAAVEGKKKVRRYLRAMERDGPVTFAHLQSSAEIEAALPVFFNAHVKRFRKTHRVSSLSTPERRLFLAELGRRFSGTGVVTLSLLMIADRPVAWNYGFQFHGSWFWYQPTFDAEQEENSPGHCLLSRIVIDACDMEDMRLVDLGLGAEGYKERFGNSSRQTLYVTLSHSLLRYVREVARFRAALLLKRSPRVESALRRLLDR